VTVTRASKLLRPGLLEGVSVLLAVPPGPPSEGALGEAVSAACAALGARVSSCWPEAAEEAALDVAVANVMREIGRIDLLAVDGAGLFAYALAQGGDGHAALRACVDAAWNATRAVVNGALLPAAEGGSVVYLAPAPDAGEYAPAACAGLENLARTLSIEWARHGIVTVTVAPGAEGVARGAEGVARGAEGLAPGAQSAAGEVAALVAYLASPAGAYFSGCVLDLRGV
jgi:NAD(P)-dependent dehydrogenase (short-subunit alcohol dehydrogenase family)